MSIHLTIKNENSPIRELRRPGGSVVVAGETICFVVGNKWDQLGLKTSWKGVCEAD